MTNIVLTGAFGRVGTALLEHLSTEYEFTLVDREPSPESRSEVADVTDRSAMIDIIEGHDAVVHLAGDPSTDATWTSALENNVIGTHNCLEAARLAGVETFVFASSNHVVGMYESEHAPEIYDESHPLVVDHLSPERPDSYYGTSKGFGELLGRQYVETQEWPTQFYALRIASLRSSRYDHPYGDAERGVDEGRWSRDSEAYRSAVRRMKATWLSRRDMAQLVDCCLTDDTVSFDIFYGVSDNDNRWFDISHGREVIGYDPQDSADEFDAPP